MNNNNNSRRLTVIIVIGLLLIGDVFFGMRYNFASKELAEMQAKVSTSEINTKILDFTKMFIKDVLQANKEVDFETRLSLETRVRDLKDAEVLAQWQKFTDSKTSSDAQTNVKKLLELLVSRIKV